jgi:preprotein translocase subunit SecY
MFEALISPWKITDLRKRLLFTAAMLAIFRVGTFIPTPGVDAAALAAYLERLRGTVLGFLDLFSGGAFRNFSIFALGIMPYISASIIMQLLTMAIPSLERLSKEGEIGRRKLTQYTRYGTVLLSLIHSLGLSFWMRGISGPDGAPVVPSPGLAFHLMTMITLTTGTCFLMWLGEQISEGGIGNGISLIIFAGIAAEIPGAIANTARLLYTGQMHFLNLLIVLTIIVFVTAAVVVMLQAQRRIPVQYAKRVVGRRVYGGQSTYIPLQINQAGVIPVIFASALLTFPSTLATFFGKENLVLQKISLFLSRGPLYSLLYVALIIFFTYFYTAVIFNPQDIADNMRRYGGFVPGIRPGRPTAEYIDRILARITLVGGIFLALIALLPQMLADWVKVPFYFGGTALLIVVGVDLDTMRQIEAQLLMRHYEGFIKKARLRGRR